MPTLKATVGIGMLGFAMLVWAGHDARAQATTPRVSLRWNAPDECPDDAELVRSVEEFLGEPLASAGAQQLSISLNVAGTSNGFSAKMRFKGPSGVEERFLEHPECRKLTEACALLAALAIDPERVKARQAPGLESATAPVTETPVTEAPESANPRRAVPAPQAVPRPADQPNAEAATPRSPVLRPDLEVAGFASVGVLPKVGPGFSALVALERAHFELGVLGRYWIPRTIAVPESQNGDIELGLWTLGARACALPWLGTWSLRGCLGADFGDMRGTGHGLASGHSSHAVFTALTAGLVLRYGQQRLAPVLGLEAGWAPSPAPFGVTIGSQKIETFRPDTWSWSGFAGLSYLL